MNIQDNAKSSMVLIEIITEKSLIHISKAGA